MANVNRMAVMAALAGSMSIELTPMDHRALLPKGILRDGGYNSPFISVPGTEGVKNRRKKRKAQKKARKAQRKK